MCNLDTLDESECIDLISASPLLVVVSDGTSCGLIGYKQCTKLQCLLCHHHCQHTSQFLKWCESNDIHIDPSYSSTEESTFSCVSSVPIPYPLSSELQRIHDEHESGKWEFPIRLFPIYDDSLKCEHGHKFSADDPVENSWISSKEVMIHKESISICNSERHFYYRPSIGACDCKQEYDGQDHLLFNLDGKHLFYYGLLFTYLHIMLEGKNPLIAFHRSMQRTFSTLSKSQPVGIKHLRQAWNCFARLLDINWQSCYLCPVCGTSPKTIVCDGTLIGFRKDFLSESYSPKSESIKEIQTTTKHKQRVLLKTVKSRELLLQYSGYTKDRKRLTLPKQLTFTQFTQMLKLLKGEGALSLTDVISRLYEETGKTIAPQAYREFLSELALNTPICGMIQIAGKPEIMEIVNKIITGVDVRQASQ